MATYNRAHYICEAIDSVLAQTYTNWELIVVDDGSTDDTEQVVKGYGDKRIKYVKNKKNMQFVRARNRALKETEGMYIAIIDDDDVWQSKDKLERQVDFLEQHLDYGIVGTAVKWFSDTQKHIQTIVPRKNDKGIRNHISRSFQFLSSSVLLRAATLDQVGKFFNTNWPMAQGHELYLRVGKVSKMANLLDIYTKYRQTPNARSGKGFKERWMVLKACIKHGKDYPYFVLSLLLCVVALIFPKKTLLFFAKFIRTG